MLTVEQVAVVKGLLMRGELLWQKGDGASGSCAWGSFSSAANPVLRDLTERDPRALSWSLRMGSLSLITARNQSLSATGALL